MDSGYILLFAIFLATFYSIVTYRHLVLLRQAVTKAWLNINVLLRQRHDELPRLVNVCKHYMRDDALILGKIIKAGSAVLAAGTQGDVQGLGQAESALRAGLYELFVQADHAPQLTSDEDFRKLQSSICQLGNSIADRRAVYNETAKQHNRRIGQFPELILARLFDFSAAELLEFPIH